MIRNQILLSRNLNTGMWTTNHQDPIWKSTGCNKKRSRVPLSGSVLGTLKRNLNRNLNRNLKAEPESEPEMFFSHKPAIWVLGHAALRVLGVREPRGEPLDSLEAPWRAPSRP